MTVRPILPEELTKEAFRAWLAEQPADRLMQRQDCSECPIATWLAETHDLCGISVEADNIQYHLSEVDDDGAELDTPSWAYSFISHVDNKGTPFAPISVRECLALLDNELNEPSTDQGDPEDYDRWKDEGGTR